MEDLEKLKSVDCDIVFTPDASEMYDENEIAEIFNFEGLDKEMEGKFRDNHFNGVGTIVKKLFHVIEPDNAYFGEKDFQQLQIVKKLIAKEKLKTEIIGCPIFREESGLAMSSRNERLSEDARKKAALIYKTLKQAKTLFKTKSAKEVCLFVTKTFEKHPEFNLEYFTIADEATLLPCTRKSKSKKYRGFIAIFIDNIRLIDNISMK